MYSLENVSALWNESGHYGSPAERLERSRLWQPYYSFMANQSIDAPYETNTQTRGLISFMVREGLLRKDDNVLDIGAGIGNYSLPLAENCASVTAMDINADCLKVLKARSAKNKIGNIEVLNTAWEEYSDHKTFDLTFSAMCPAICSYEEILRLESITKRTACLLTVTRGSYEKCRMELMRQLPLKNIGGMVTEALHYYNVLYLMGRQPNVKCWSERFTAEERVSDLIKRYSIYFKIFGADEDISIPYMEKFFNTHSKGGMVHDECQMNYAFIYWNV